MTVKRADTPEELKDALTGIDALVITLSVKTPPTYQTKLIDAAAAAGVKWVLPNEWGSDTAHAGQNENPAHKSKIGYRRRIEDLGMRWVAVVTGQWYDFSAGGGFFGVDMVAKKATLYDGGDVRTVTSTLAQGGRAAAALLSLPVSGSKPCVEDWANKHLYVESFVLSQKEMWAAAQTATGTAEKDWTVEHKEAKPVLAAAYEKLMTGDFNALFDVIYVSNWVPDGGGNFKATNGTANEALGLPKEDLIEVTKYAYEIAQKGGIHG